ncbi:MAG TPA: hypothetical protein VI759_05760 [Dehalococcoidia bacterium]|nr:hypothetical protein [Dehalococcoidia bacterium]
MPILITLGDARDIVVIAYGIAGLVFFFIGIIVLVVLVFSVKGLIGALRSTLDESVKPTLESVKNTADTVRGTTEFVGKTAIAPIVRTYGMFAGVRKGLGVLAGLQKKDK